VELTGAEKVVVSFLIERFLSDSAGVGPLETAVWDKVEALRGRIERSLLVAGHDCSQMGAVEARWSEGCARLLDQGLQAVGKQEQIWLGRQAARRWRPMRGVRCDVLLQDAGFTTNTYNTLVWNLSRDDSRHPYEIRLREVLACDAGYLSTCRNLGPQRFLEIALVVSHYGYGPIAETLRSA
jgi:hypothetical protein